MGTCCSNASKSSGSVEFPVVSSGKQGRDGVNAPANKFVSDTLGLTPDSNPSAAHIPGTSRVKTYLDASVTTKITRSAVTDANRLAAAKQRERKEAILQRMGVFDADKVGRNYGSNVKSESDSDTESPSEEWDAPTPRRPRSDPLYNRSRRHRPDKLRVEENPNSGHGVEDDRSGRLGKGGHRHKRRSYVEATTRDLRVQDPGDAQRPFTIVLKNHVRGNAAGCSASLRMRDSPVDHGADAEVARFAAVKGDFSGSDAESEPEQQVERDGRGSRGSDCGGHGRRSGDGSDPARFPSRGSPCPQHCGACETLENGCEHIIPKPHRVPPIAGLDNMHSQVWDRNTMISPSYHNSHHSYATYHQQQQQQQQQHRQQRSRGSPADLGEQDVEHATRSHRGSTASPVPPQLPQSSSRCSNPYDVLGDFAPSEVADGPSGIASHGSKHSGPSTLPSHTAAAATAPHPSSWKPPVAAKPASSSSTGPGANSGKLSPRAAAILESKDGEKLSYSQLKKQLLQMKQANQPQPASSTATGSSTSSESGSVRVPMPEQSDQRVQGVPPASRRTSATTQASSSLHSRHQDHSTAGVFVGDSFGEVGGLPHAIRPRRASTVTTSEEEEGTGTHDSERALRYLTASSSPQPMSVPHSQLQQQQQQLQQQQQAPVPRLRGGIADPSLHVQPLRSTAASHPLPPPSNHADPLASHVPVMVHPNIAAQLQVLLGSVSAADVAVSIPIPAATPSPNGPVRPVLVPVKVSLPPQVPVSVVDSPRKTTAKPPKAGSAKASTATSGTTSKKATSKKKGSGKSSGTSKKAKSGSGKGGKKKGSNAVGAAHVAAAMTAPKADLAEMIRSREMELNSSFESPMGSPRSSRSQLSSASSRGGSVVDMSSSALAARTMDMLLGEVKGLDAMSKTLSARAQISRRSAEQAAWASRGDVDDDDLSKVWGGVQRSPTVPKSVQKSSPSKSNKKTLAAPWTPDDRGRGSARRGSALPAPSLSPASSSRSGSGASTSSRASISSLQNRWPGTAAVSPASIIRVPQRRRSSTTSPRSVSSSREGSASRDKYGNSIRQQIRQIRQETRGIM